MELPFEPRHDRDFGQEGHGGTQPGAQLMPSENEEAFRTRWSAVQTGFVDEPPRAVKEADELVAEVMKRLAEVFASERSKLEEQWAREKQVSTEDLRIVLQRYRSFFDRLLGIRAPGNG
jgi:hypothetical protein